MEKYLINEREVSKREFDETFKYVGELVSWKWDKQRVCKYKQSWWMIHDIKFSVIRK